MTCVNVKTLVKLFRYIIRDVTVFKDCYIICKPIKTVTGQIKLIIDIVFSKMRDHKTNISRCIIFARGCKSVYKVRYSTNIVLIIISSAQDKKSTVTIETRGKVTKSVTAANLAKPFLIGRVTNVTRVESVKHPYCAPSRLFYRCQ